MENGRAGALAMHTGCSEDRKDGELNLPITAGLWNTVLTIGGTFFFRQLLLMRLLILMSQAIHTVIAGLHLHSMIILEPREAIHSTVMNAPEVSSHMLLLSVWQVLFFRGVNMNCMSQDIIMVSPTAILTAR